MKTSQKQNILRHLLYGPLCGQEQDWSLGRRFPARIHQLRKVGFPIEKRRCDQGHDHQTYQVEFYLNIVFDPKHPSLDYFDCCADCGQPGALIFTEGPHKRHDGRILFPVACSVCGKGDWR